MAPLLNQWASTIIELPTLTVHQALLPFSIFSLLHGIRVAIAYRQAIEQASAQSLRDGQGARKPLRVPWGQALFSVLVMSLGGGSTAGMLLGMPPAWLGSNVVIPTYTLSFILIHYTPLYEILLQNVPPTVLDSFLILADGSLRALSISKNGVEGSRMRFAADSHPNGNGITSEPWFAMLFLGTIAGCGGGLWADLLKLKTHHWTLSTPSFFHTPTWDMKAAFLSAFFYATSTSPQFYGLLKRSPSFGWGSGDEKWVPVGSGLLEPQDAKAMTMLLHCTLMLGQRVDLNLFRLASSVTASLKGGNESLSSSPVAAESTRKSKRSPKAVKSDEEDSHAEVEPVRRRRSRKVEEEVEEEEQEEEEEVASEKKGKRKTGGRKAASTLAQDLTPTRNSTRVRKPTRQDIYE